MTRTVGSVPLGRTRILPDRPSSASAAAKALGAPAGLRWADVEVTHDGAGRPALAASGTVAEEAARRGVLRWHLSITHDGGVSVAMVVAEA